MRLNNFTIDRPLTSLLCTSVHVSSLFYLPTITTNKSAPYQLHLRCPPETKLQKLPFKSLHIEFSNKDISPIVIKHKETEIVDVQLVSLSGEGEKDACLRWNPDGLLVLSGKANPKETLGDLKVSFDLLYFIRTL